VPTLPDDTSTDGSIQIARDRRLVRRLRNDDQQAMHEFYDVYFPKLYRYATRRLRTPQDIDDVIQRVLTIAAARIETYRGEATLLTWLIQICRHEVARHYRATARRDAAVQFLDDDVLRAVVESLEAPAGDEPETAAHRAELAASVQTALDQLPDHYADALQMKYLQGRSSKEIAGHFGIADDAAQSLLARARRSFREICSVALRLELNLHDKAHPPAETT
jgi:RNA polymerase sigma-70 factor (ECF subfamily)